MITVHLCTNGIKAKSMTKPWTTSTVESRFLEVINKKNIGSNYGDNGKIAGRQS